MFYGPKGVAGLYLRQGIRLKSQVNGGRQENHRRAGTHNVPGIVGLGMAAELAASEMKQRISHMKKLRDKLWVGLSKSIDRIYLTGHPKERLPHHLSFCVEFIEGEALLLLMELEGGIGASSGSICGDDTSQTSTILTGIGINESLARGAIRFSVGKDNTEEEIDRVIKSTPTFVERLRKKSRGYSNLKPNHPASKS